MNFNQRHIEKWVPAAVSFMAAVLLGGCLVFYDAFLFLYPQTEALNLLYAQLFTGKSTFIFSEYMLGCIQNINLIVVGVLIPAVWLDLPPYSSLWLWQSVINTLLLIRGSQFLRSKHNDAHTYLSCGLFYGNPLLWYALLCMPSQILTAWLLIEWLIHRKHHPNQAALFLLLLSCSGSVGFMLAAAACISVSISYFVLHSNHASNMALSWSALLPSFLLYVVLTLNNQTIGGAFLPAYPSLLVDWTQFSWLSFQSHHNLQQFLLWFGNGGADWWKPLSLFGLFALLGIVSSIQKRITSSSICVIVMLLLSFWILNPAAPDGHLQFSLPVLIILIPFASQGIIYAASSIRTYKTEMVILILIGVLFLGWIRQPFVWEKRIIQANLLADIQNNIETIIESKHSLPQQLISIPFHPQLYSSLGKRDQDVQVIPEQYAVHTQFPQPAANMYGFRFNLIHVLQWQPDIIFMLPKTLYKQEQDSHIFSSISYVREILDAGYTLNQIKQIRYYQKKEPSSIRTERLLKKLNEPKISALKIVSPTETNPQYSFLFNPTLNPLHWVRWEMESHYSLTETLGFAFGTTPERSISAAGSNAAVSGLGKNRKFMGNLQSKPFVIQGDDISFYANMPQSASTTVMCLAVQQFIAPHDDHHPPTLRHIFDHQPGTSLADGTHYYMKPEELHYEPDGIYGWKVIRVLHGGETGGWQMIDWSLRPWRGKQAVWLAADRDRQSWMAIDHIMQSNREPGLYWDFEFGDYLDWNVEGQAFGTHPSTGRQGEQINITGMEGNYFINSYYEGSDEYTGSLTSPEFSIHHNVLTFFVGGGDNIEQVYVALVVDGETVYKTTGKQSETLNKVSVDLTPWLNKTGQIHIVDHASGSWGHILADDFRIYNQ